jgi:hypothetical protein
MRVARATAATAYPVEPSDFQAPGDALGPRPERKRVGPDPEARATTCAAMTAKDRRCCEPVTSTELDGDARKPPPVEVPPSMACPVGDCG